MRDLAVVEWPPAQNLADRDPAMQVTGNLRTPVGHFGTRQWVSKDFNNHRRPGFQLPGLGTWVSNCHTPKVKGILVGIQPLGSADGQETAWMCPCGWECSLDLADK